MYKKGERLKELRIRSGKTLEEAGRLAGISKQNLFKYENDIITNIPSDKIEILANVYGVSPSYIMGWEEKEIGLETVSIPVYDKISCGNGCLILEQPTAYEVTPKEWLNGGEYFYLRAKGDSMIGARIYDGDLLLIRKQPVVENGEYAAVVINEEAVLKKVYFKGGTLVLQSENPNYPPEIVTEGEVRIIGKLKKVIINM